MKLQPQTGRYFGISSPIHQVSGLRLSERTYSPDFKTPSHSHPEAYFCLILEGTSRQTYGAKNRVREPLTTTFYPPNELQSEFFGGAGGRIFNIEIDARWLCHFREYSVIEEQSNDVRGGAVAWLMSKLYHEFCRMDYTSALMIEGLTLEIIAEASRTYATAGDRRSRWLEQARDILHEQFADNLTLACIAKTVGVHPVYLASSFRKKYNSTMGDYRQRLRIEFACGELSKSRSSLADVALAAGFANQAHFSRTFKRFTGTTPAKYRANSHRS
jgi:AraC family transcriptional regulator